jgi:RimJ/RimL family protein N-acetyltransferase
MCGYDKETKASAGLECLDGNRAPARISAAPANAMFPLDARHAMGGAPRQSATTVNDSSPVLIELPDHLVGPRVVVRPYDEADAPSLWEAVDGSRTHLAPWMPWVGAYHAPNEALAFVRQFRAKWLTREDLIVGIFDLASGRLLGGSGLHRIDWQIRRFEIGYWLRQSAEGHGYVAEAVQLLIRLAFGLAANRVEIRTDVRNSRSRAVAERLGFQLEGCLRRFLPDAEGQPSDILIFSLLR